MILQEQRPPSNWATSQFSYHLTHKDMRETTVSFRSCKKFHKLQRKQISGDQLKRTVEEETGRCQEREGAGVMQKMDLILSSIPPAFLLFEDTSGLNFPLCRAERKSSGWVDGGSKPLLPARLSFTKLRESRSH